MGIRRPLLQTTRVHPKRPIRTRDVSRGAANLAAAELAGKQLCQGAGISNDDDGARYGAEDRIRCMPATHAAGPDCLRSGLLLCECCCWHLPLMSYIVVQARPFPRAFAEDLRFREV